MHADVLKYERDFDVIELLGFVVCITYVLDAKIIF